MDKKQTVIQAQRYSRCHETLADMYAPSSRSLELFSDLSVTSLLCFYENGESVILHLLNILFSLS